MNTEEMALNDLRSDVETALRELLDATKSSRTTFRVDLPKKGVTVQVPLAESRAPGVSTMMSDGSLDQRGSATCQWLERHRRPLIQNDTLDADPVPPPELIRIYGAKAQMLAPVLMDSQMIGWVSVHYLPGSRKWSSDDVSALESAASRIQARITESSR